MKNFVCILSQKSRGNLDGELLLKHIKFLEKLSLEGILIAAGPFADNDRAIVLINAKDENAAKGILLSDPFINEEYYGHFEIHEFYHANKKNSWLMQNDQTKDNL